MIVYSHYLLWSSFLEVDEKVSHISAIPCSTVGLADEISPLNCSSYRELSLLETALSEQYSSTHSVKRIEVCLSSGQFPGENHTLYNTEAFKNGILISGIFSFVENL